jgi:O-antigen ligase
MKISRESLFLLAPAIYLFILPLAHTTGLRSVAFGVSVLLLIWTWRAHATPPVPLKAPFAIWLFIALLSLIWAVYPDYSIGEIKSEILCGFLTFVIFFSITRGRRELTIWIVVLAVSSLVVGTFSLVQFGRGINPYEVGMYGGAVHYSAYLAIVIPIFLSASLLWPGRRRVVMVGLVFFLVFTAYGSKNRGIWLSLIVEFVIFGYMYLRHLNLDIARRKWIVAIMALSLTAITIAFLSVSGERLVTDWGARLGIDGNKGAVLSGVIKNDLRPKLWKDSIAWITERPWTGAGFGRGVLSKEIQQQQGLINHAHAHNILLNYAIQLGVLGPIVLGLLVFSVVRELLNLTKSVDLDIRTYGIAGLAIVGGFFGVEGMIEDVFVRHLGWLFWAVIGMILGYASNATRQTSLIQESAH